jgi:hypothetical protein
MSRKVEMPNLLDKNETQTIDGQEFTVTKPGVFTKLGKILTGVAVGLEDPSRLGGIFNDEARAQAQMQKFLLEQKKQEQQAQVLALLGKAIGADSDAVISQANANPLDVNSIDFGSRESLFDGDIESQFQEFVKSKNEIPATELGFTGGSVGGLSIGQTPESKIEQSIATDVLKQRSKEIDKRSTGAELTADDFENFAGQFQLSLAELKEVFGESVDDGTLAGFGLRQAAKVAQRFDKLPETKAFRDRIQSFATPLAKSAGEDRLTNEDIKRFTAILQDTLKGSSETNARKMRNLLLDFEKKGADISTILGVFDSSGGALKQAADLTRNFKEDVKKAGKKIEGGSFTSTPGGNKFKIRKK